MRQITELLCPAGTFKNMQYAFAYGADAVYAGQARYSLRVRNNDFDEENLKKGIDYAHSLGKKFYVVVNIQAHNAKLKTFIEDIRPVIEMKPDALIMSDAGMIMMARGFSKSSDSFVSTSQRSQLGNGEILAANGRITSDFIQRTVFKRDW